MKSVSVSCPDDRVALARRGALTAEEWQDFATHLTECVDCRLAWRLGSDFEHSGAARIGDERLIAHAVKAALATSARPHTKLIRVAIAAAVTLVAAGAASAAIALHVRHRAAIAAPEASGTTRPPKGRGGARRAVSSIAAESPAASVAESAPPPAQQAAPPPAPMAAAAQPPLVARTPPRPARTPQPRSAPDPFDEAGRSAAPSLTPPPQSADAVGLFAQALAERQEGRNQTAIANFRRLQREFPTAQEATVSLISLGDLLLGAGLRADALLAFETYLQRAPKGTLAPEAWIGKARALAALGRASEARAAWSEIAKRFPNSGYARRALDGRTAAP